MVEKIKVQEETSEIQNAIQKQFGYNGENQEWHEYADSEDKEKQEFGSFLQDFSHQLLLKPTITSYAN